MKKSWIIRALLLVAYCVPFAFLGAYIDEYANKSDTKQLSTFMSATKYYPIYITKYKGCRTNSNW